MIAASEEFLREIAPKIYADGLVSTFQMTASAVMASVRFMSLGTSLMVIEEKDAVTLLAFRLGHLSKYERKEHRAGYVGEEIHDDGIPFVAWAIGAESRRIATPAQPGEGDFIKYLGRD